MVELIKLVFVLLMMSMLQNVEDLGAVNPPLILTLPSVAGIQVAPLLDTGANHVHQIEDLFGAAHYLL
jgi:hypothetical protein